MKLNSSPNLVMACLVSGSMLIADCMVIWEAVILFSPSLKRKDIVVRRPEWLPSYLSYICPSPEGAWTCRTQGISEEVPTLSGNCRNSVGPCRGRLWSMWGSGLRESQGWENRWGWKLKEWTEARGIWESRWVIAKGNRHHGQVSRFSRTNTQSKARDHL